MIKYLIFSAIMSLCCGFSTYAQDKEDSVKTIVYKYKCGTDAGGIRSVDL